MRRDLAFRILARHVDPGTVMVAAYQAAFEWLGVAPEHRLTYTSIGAMGQASSLALGMALGRPDKRFVVLDGDGSLLMNLGTLVTIAEAKPKNLVHFVCENGTYEANGGHPIPGKDRISFAGFARAAGYPEVEEFAALERFEAELPRLLAQEGPVFADLKLELGPPPQQDYERMHGAAARNAFIMELRRS